MCVISLCTRGALDRSARRRSTAALDAHGHTVLISYLADQPTLAEQLVPGLVEHWASIIPGYTADARSAKFLAHMNRDTLPIAWVAHDGAKALGTAALRVCDLEGREDLTPWLGGVYVCPPFRGRGIASALCVAVEQKARQLGASALYLFTTDQSRVYAHLGWKFFERIQWHGRDGEIMVKHFGGV
jgi:GNAT superfamily N-acetyltransferase